MRILLVTLFAFSVITVFSQQKAKLVYFNHSLRWASENNFPDFLSDDLIRNAIEQGVIERLNTRLHSDVQHRPIEYRVIDGFGKAKIEWPKKFDPASREVGVLSAISRDVSGFGISWTLVIQTRESGKLSMEKRVNHEIEPISYSGYMTAQRWLDADEFVSIFLKLVDEALGVAEALPTVIKVGSMERVQQKKLDIMPDGENYNLSVAGAMLEESNASYELRRKDSVIAQVKYKRGFSTSAPRNLFARSLFSSILHEITGLNTYYSFDSRESRVAKLITNNDNEKKLRIDWLTETDEHGESMGEITVERVISPITGQLFWKDSLYAHFVYYKRLNGKPVRGFSASAPYHHIHNVEGIYGKKKLRVVYPEQEGLVIVYLDEKPAAVLSMFNENSESRSFSGQRLSKNKKIMSGQSSLKQPEVNDATAERYSLLVSPELSEKEVREILEPFFMLFLGISQSF